ncbi:MAG: alpha/beta hydrolase [Gammaproteobacteria bacterium]|nr:alpha/beta hydrolase [Gammaproteobacteria bacterium]
MPEPAADVLIPQGHYITLAGRGRCFYREHPNPGKPTLLLLHGMVGTALVNWHRCFHHLAPHFHIIAPDLRGHGRSFRKTRSFRFSSCAKDIAALMRVLDLRDVILVGYSMGGSIAQHLLQHHPQRIGGAVFSASGFQPQVKPSQRIFVAPFMAALVGMARLSHLLTRAPRRILAGLLPIMNMRDPQFQSLQLSLIDEIRRTPFRLTLEAGREMAFHDASDWLPGFTQPCAVLVTDDDAVFPAEQQKQMAALLPNASRFHFSGNHRSCTHALYGPALNEACQDVAKRIDARRIDARHIDARIA